jgi:AbrB family looped-hinge helix DNA binding protein
MSNTTLSSKGQVVIPKNLREFLGWKSGMKIAIKERDGTIVLAPEVKSEPKARYEDVLRVSKMLSYDGPPQSDADIQRGLEEYFRKEWKS